MTGSHQQEEHSNGVNLIISFRGKKVEIDVVPGLTVGTVKSRVASFANTDNDNSREKADDGDGDGNVLGAMMTASNIKLIHKGKVLSDDDAEMYSVLGLPDIRKGAPATDTKRTYKLLATGISSAEAERTNRQFEEGMRKARIRDDLSDRGKLEEARRQRLGRQVLGKAAARTNQTIGRNDKKYGFGKVETLPNLPNEEEAKRILTELANDPGILACMAKHEWNVGSLAELFPEGKVGETDVCVMGLNQNKGQKILLRIRTDDLKGFRKPLSIRKVLYHELAHNVHSEHNVEFFQLMRQIERECNELDWTKTSGQATSGGGGGGGMYQSLDQSGPLYEGGTYRLGSTSESSSDVHRLIPAREMAARAAILRLTAEEEEIERHCGCGSRAIRNGNDDGAIGKDENGSTSKDGEINNRASEGR